jgi:hypothetical protein
MTIPAASDWCPACEETCVDHAAVCTVCGTSLTTPPGRSPETASRSPSVFPTLAEVLPQVRQANLDLTSRLRAIRQEIAATQADQARVWQDLAQVREDAWQEAPAEWMEPNTASRSRPTARTTLDSLPQTVLQPHSSILYEALVAFGGGTADDAAVDSWTGEGTLGDFGIPLTVPLQLSGPVILASPRTGRDGLSAACLARIQGLAADATPPPPFLLYFDRGGDVTFVQKALLAQKAGAAACLIGNHVSQPWPYIMKDSKGEATSGSLAIPTVLLPKAAATRLVSQVLLAEGKSSQLLPLAHLDIALTSSRSDCVVCTEAFVTGATVVRLPTCGHVFHQACALPWLSAHNTCPYCRRELPTDDEEYERERRRTQRTHAGSAAQANNEADHFYS